MLNEVLERETRGFTDDGESENDGDDADADGGGDDDDNANNDGSSHHGLSVYFGLMLPSEFPMCSSFASSSQQFFFLG